MIASIKDKRKATTAQSHNWISMLGHSMVSDAFNGPLGQTRHTVTALLGIERQAGKQACLGQHCVYGCVCSCMV